MKKTRYGIWTRVLSALFAAVLVCGCALLPNCISVSAATNNSKNLSTIISEICADGSHKATLLNAASQKVATVEILTGTIVEDEKSAVYSSDKITDSTGAVNIKSSYWGCNSEVKSYLKITVLKDTALRLYNPKFTHGGYYNWTNISVMKTSNGVTSSVVATGQVNPNKEGEDSYTWAEGTYFDKTVSVKAGDVIYFCVNGNKWGYGIPTDVLAVETVENYQQSEDSSKKLTEIVSEAISNASAKGTLLNGAFEVVATTELMSGTIVDDENALGSANGKICNADESVSITTENWQGVAFLKITVVKDATLHLYNPEFTHGGWYSWTNISIMKVSNGVRTSICSTPEVNPNGESGTRYTWKEGAFFDCVASVKAGDVLYFCVNGNKYGGLVPTNVLTIDVMAYGAATSTTETVSAGMMIYNVAQTKGGTVENGGLTSYTIKTGTLEQRIDFDTFTDDKLSFGSVKSYISPTAMWVDQDYSVIYQVNILQDCDFRFTHPSAPRGSWAAGYTQVQIWRTTNVGTEKLSDIFISALEVPANYYCPDTYEAKAGETYYMVYRTSNSYYGATELAIGYEASAELKELPQTESAVVGDAISSGKLSGSLYAISFATGSDHTAASGNAFTATNVTVPSGGVESIVITALEDIRLDLVATGADRMVLADGTEVTKTAHLAAGDSVCVEFSQSGTWALSLTADRSLYVAGARRNGDESESYDLYDMINQMAFMGDASGVNMRKLSTFSIESGKLSGSHSSVLLSDVASGKFVSGEGGANTGLVPVWYGNSKGIQLVADTGYDTIVTVTAAKDAYVTMTFPVLTSNVNWALETYVKALLMDTDGTTIVLYNKIVPEFPDSDYFAVEAHLQAGQSLVLVYYTPTGLYGAVEIMPTFTLDTTAYDASQCADFAEAKALRVVKEAIIAQLQAHFAEKNEDAYSGEKWLEMETILQEGIDLINDAADEATINALLEQYKAKLDAVGTNEQIEAELNAYKQEKIAELDAFMATLNKRDYSSANWQRIQDLYNAGVNTINKQTSQTKVNNALTSVKTSIENVEKDGTGGAGIGLIVACVAVVVIGAGVVAFVLVSKKRKLTKDSKDEG